MTRKLLLTFLLLVLSGVFLFLTVFNIDPNGNDFLFGFIAILGTLFLGISSFFTLLFFFWKELVSQRSMGNIYFWKCLRRGSFFGGGVALSLLLSYMNMFSLIEFLMVIALFSVLEFIIYFSGKSEKGE